MILFSVNKYDDLTRMLKTTEYSGVALLDLADISPASSIETLSSAASQNDIDGIISTVESNVTNLSPNRSFEYQLDNNENRIQTDIVLSPGDMPNTTTYTPDNQDRYKTVGNFAITYDQSGNQLNDGISNYRYDAHNRVDEISTPSGKVAISYDALGRQIRLESDGKVREFIYAGQRLIEWRENGVLTAQIVPLERPHQYAHLAIGGY